MSYALQCYGRLVPRECAGAEYRVEYELHICEGSLRAGELGGTFRATCSKFLMRSVDSQPIPDGDYNLQWRQSKCLLMAAVIALFVLPAARAQQETEQKGLDQGNYNIKQSIEFGGRFTSISGNQNIYDTFVNLQQGARLLGFTTEMRSLDHHATMFDRLYFSNFGYGGDPDLLLAVKANKLSCVSSGCHEVVHNVGTLAKAKMWSAQP